MIELYICKICKEQKTISSFPKCKIVKRDHGSTCKACKKARMLYLNNKRNIIFVDEKICSTCRERKVNKEFSPNNNYNDGLSSCCRECTRKRNKKSYYSLGNIKTKNIQLKKEIIQAYGGICTCCGENNENVLTIDHIDNTGKEHRKEIGSGSIPIYKWLKQNNFPKDNFQLLCMSCNWAKYKYGECYHKRNFREIVSNENLY